MPNKHFCQGPYCHTRTTQDRFLKSRGVIRGRYAYFDRDFQNHHYNNDSDKYFCSQNCKMEWLSINMTNIEQGRPVEFISCLLYTSPSPRDRQKSRMPSSA